MTVSKHEIVLTKPYRLDLTVAALRRVASNVVDVYTPGGEYLRVLEHPEHAAIVRARQVARDRLTVEVTSEAADHEPATELLKSMLGIDRSADAFVEAARQVPWLAAIVDRFRGLRPPRYPSLWEASVNAVVFQQVSLQSASAIIGRLITTLGEPVTIDGRWLYAFPSLERFHDTPDAPLRAAGLSAGKLGTLRRVVDGIRSGALSAERLERLPSAEAARDLQEIRGIGPWTAAVILLRGLGRLDVFPPKDSGVAANLRRLTDDATEMGALLEKLGEQRGLLYFYLLLARLDQQGRLGEPSVSWLGGK